MKKIKMVHILLFFIVTMCLISCQKKPNQISPDEEVQEDTDAPIKGITPDENIDSTQVSPDEEKQDETDTPIKWITPVENIDLSDMNLYSQWNDNNAFFSTDGAAKLSLYVNAATNDAGEFVLDDGHDWLLIMETPFGEYPLFPRRNIQIGSLSYSVFFDYDGEAYNIFHVLVTVSQTAGYEIYDCIFDNEREEFKVVPVYNATNINNMT